MVARARRGRVRLRREDGPHLLHDLRVRCGPRGRRSKRAGGHQIGRPNPSPLALLAFLRGHWDTFLEPVRKRGRAASADEEGVAVLEHYGLIKWKQELELGCLAFIELTNYDFVKRAESNGAKGYRIEATDELRAGDKLELRGPVGG